MDMTVLVLIAAAAAAVGGIAYVGCAMEKKRQEAMAAAAVRIGFSFEPVSAVPPGGGFTSLPLFNHGHSREYTSIMRGRLTADTAALLFDYRYVTGSGKNRSTHRQSVAVLTNARVSFPVFELRPENILHKIGSVFGYQDFDFAFSPRFSGQYLLRGQDEAAVRGLFGQSVVSYFESNPGWCLEGRGGCLVVYRGGTRIEPDEVPLYLDRLRALFCVFPL